MTACIMIANSLKNSECINDFIDLMNKWCFMMTNLVKSGLKSDVNNIWLKAMIRKFIYMAPAAQYLYHMYDILFNEVSKYFKIIKQFINFNK